MRQAFRSRRAAEETRVRAPTDTADVQHLPLHGAHPDRTQPTHATSAPPARHRGSRRRHRHRVCGTARAYRKRCETIGSCTSRGRSGHVVGHRRMTTAGRRRGSRSTHRRHLQSAEQDRRVSHARGRCRQTGTRSG